MRLAARHCKCRIRIAGDLYAEEASLTDARLSTRRSFFTGSSVQVERRGWIEEARMAYSQC